MGPRKELERSEIIEEDGALSEETAGWIAAGLGVLAIGIGAMVYMKGKR